jgi:hypothetical protein
MNDDGENTLVKHFWAILGTLIWLDAAFFISIGFAAPDSVLMYILWPALGLLILIPICARYMYKAYYGSGRRTRKERRPREAKADIANSQSTSSATL